MLYEPAKAKYGLLKRAGAEFRLGTLFSINAYTSFQFYLWQILCCKCMEITKIFGEGDEPEHQVGDVAIDDFGQTLLVVNAEGTYLKSYSIMDLRYDQSNVVPLQQFFRGMKACTLFGRLQTHIIDLGGKSEPIEFGLLGANSRTVHFFRFKQPSTKQEDQAVPDIDDIMSGKSMGQSMVLKSNEDDDKIGSFFKKLKDRVLPASITHEKSNLRIYLEKQMTLDQPYIIFPSNNSTLINIVTYSGNCLKFSIEGLLTEEERKILNPPSKASLQAQFFKQKDNSTGGASTQENVIEGVLRMSFKIKDFLSIKPSAQQTSHKEGSRMSKANKGAGKIRRYVYIYISKGHHWD